MAVVLEGYCCLTVPTSGFIRIPKLDSVVTNYSGDYTNIDVRIFTFAKSNVKFEIIQDYQASTQSWTARSIIDEDPGEKRLYLVRKTDFPNDYYPNTDAARFESLALGIYRCTIVENNTNYYWSPAAEPLSTPTGLNADNITSNSATISWNAVENATDYKVQYRRQGDTTWNE